MYSAPGRPPPPLPSHGPQAPYEIIDTESEKSGYTDDETVQLDEPSASESGSAVVSESPGEVSDVSDFDVPQPPKHRKSVRWHDEKSGLHEFKTHGKASTSKSYKKTLAPNARSGWGWPPWRWIHRALKLMLYCVSVISGFLLAIGITTSMISSMRDRGLGGILAPPFSMHFPQFGWADTRGLEDTKIREGLIAQGELAALQEILVPHVELPKILTEAKNGVYFLHMDVSKMLSQTEESRKVVKVLEQIGKVVDETKRRADKINSIKTMVVRNALRANQHSSRSLMKYDYVLKPDQKINDRGSYSHDLYLLIFYLGSLLEQVEDQQMGVIELEQAVAQAQFLFASIAFPGQDRMKRWKSIVDSETFKDMPFVRYHHVDENMERLTGSFEENKDQLGEANVKIKNIKGRIDGLYNLLEGKRAQGNGFKDEDNLDLWRAGVDHVITRLEPAAKAMGKTS